MIASSSSSSIQRWLRFLLLLESLLRCRSRGFVPTTRMHQGWGSRQRQRQRQRLPLKSPNDHSDRSHRRIGIGIVSTPEHGQTKTKACPPSSIRIHTTKRFVRDNNNKSTFSPEEEEQPIPSSMVRSVLGIVFRGNANDGESSSAASRLYLKKSKKPKKDSMLETGVEAALVLGDKRRRKQWTQGVRKQFPWIPTEILSVCTDGLASAFESLAPKDLKRALQPGGLERTRSKIGGEVVRNLQGQSLIQQLPLPKEDKRKLLTNLVDFSLDYFLRDLEPVLATPCSKLRALDRERREIQNYMSFWELAWYRLRYKPGSTACFGLLSLWAAYTIVPFFRSSSNVTMVMKQSNEVLSSAWAILVTCILNGKRALYKYLIIHMRR